MKERSRSANCVGVRSPCCASLSDVMNVSIAWRRFRPGHVLERAYRILSKN